MENVDIISAFLGRLELWIYDNIGNGDGTQHIHEIWKDDAAMADHLCDKWRSYVARARENSGKHADESSVQTIALMYFLTSLDAHNHSTFIKFIAENGRPKY